jgi:hypothetical protein
MRQANYLTSGDQVLLPHSRRSSGVATLNDDGRCRRFVLAQPVIISHRINCGAGLNAYYLSVHPQTCSG